MLRSSTHGILEQAVQVDFVSLFELLNTAVTLTVAVSGILGFIFRGWILEKIKSSFTKAVSKELESYKHDLSLQLEAYKTSLIRELEQHKANIDLQRAIALKMAEARLDALRGLTEHFDEWSSSAIICARSETEHRVVRQKNAIAAYDEFRKRQRDVQIFLPIDMHQEIANLGIELMKLVATSGPAVPEDDPVLLDVINRSSIVTLSLRDLIYKPVDISNPKPERIGSNPPPANAES
jgi:hypothetical protein